MTMLYMVEMDLADRSREAAWNDWYAGHLVRLLGMPGFRSAQRFVAEAPARSPFLAVYQIESADALASPSYRAGGGPASPGDWTAIMIDWHRNLFEAGAAPEVAMDERLVVIDRADADAPALPAGLSVLRCVGLARTVVERGVAICDRAAAAAWRSRALPGTRVFRPMTALARAAS